MLGGHFQISELYLWSHFIHFIKVVQCSNEHELKLNVTAEERIKLYPLLNSGKWSRPIVDKVCGELRQGFVARIFAV